MQVLNCFEFIILQGSSNALSLIEREAIQNFEAFCLCDACPSLSFIRRFAK